MVAVDRLRSTKISGTHQPVKGPGRLSVRCSDNNGISLRCRYNTLLKLWCHPLVFGVATTCDKPLGGATLASWTSAGATVYEHHSLPSRLPSWLLSRLLYLLLLNKIFKKPNEQCLTKKLINNIMSSRIVTQYSLILLSIKRRTGQTRRINKNDTDINK